MRNENRIFDIHQPIPAIIPNVSDYFLIVCDMSAYIDTEHTDMQKFAFEQIQGLDLPVWKDVKSVDEIKIDRISGRLRAEIHYRQEQ